MNAPNEYGSICFDDFILYSRAAKKLAELYINNIEYDIDKMVKNFDMERFNLYCNNQERLKSAVETEIMFKFPMKPEMMRLIVDKLIEKM